MDITDTLTVPVKKNSHDIFCRLVGRIMGTLDLAKADDNVKKTIKAYIWQAEQDLCSKNIVDNKK